MKVGSQHAPVRYVARVIRDGRYLVAIFPDCPGCATQAGPSESILAQATEAVEGWLEAHLIGGELPPRPRAKATGRGHMIVAVYPMLSTRLQLRWARDDAGLSQAQLGARIGVSRQQISLVESPDSNPTVATLERVAKALGKDLHIELRTTPPAPAKVTPLRSRRTAPTRAPRRA